MIRTLCQSVALGRIIIALWLLMIAELFGIMVKAVLSLVGNVSNTLPDMAMLILSVRDGASGCVLLVGFAAKVIGFEAPEAHQDGKRAITLPPRKRKVSSAQIGAR